MHREREFPAKDTTVWSQRPDPRAGTHRMDVNEYSYPTILVSCLDDTQPDLRPKRQQDAAGYGRIDRTRCL